MSHSRSIVARSLALAVLCLLPGHAEAQVDSGVIRLERPAEPSGPSGESESIEPVISGPRRGFDYAAFESRFQALWFQRKAFLSDGRDADAVAQAKLIRDFCAEEGVIRLEAAAGALIAEAGRSLREGHYRRSLEALDLAEKLDPGRPQIRYGRALVIWKSRRSVVDTGVELLAAAGSTLRASFVDLTLFHRAALLGVAVAALAFWIFALFMLVRYQHALRHEVEEWTVQRAPAVLAPAAGWAVLLLPLVSWIAAGWSAIYWLAVTFRFQRRTERMTTVVLLLMVLLIAPGYGAAVAFYGMTANPSVRATLESAHGEYDPNRILELRQLVETHPESPVYHFLLAGLYKSGRYFEEAFAHYKEALARQPALEEAYINLGNIFYTTGQHAEAVANYSRALEINPRSVLAYYNMHLAQSEAFQFKEAEQSLSRGRSIDAKALAGYLSQTATRSGGPAALDATLELASVWEAAIRGRDQTPPPGFGEGVGLREIGGQLMTPTAAGIGVALLLCTGLAWIGSGEEPARRCIRCGRAFCRYCKSGKEAREYCSQCRHLFVLGEGLAPETKNRKLYEVQRHERNTRRARRWSGVLLPGAGQLLRGKPGRGLLLAATWVVLLAGWQPLVLLPLEKLGGIESGLLQVGQAAVPAIFHTAVPMLFVRPSLVLLWLMGNAWIWRRRDA